MPLDVGLESTESARCIAKPFSRWHEISPIGPCAVLHVNFHHCVFLIGKDLAESHPREG
jgi:hypothetical protein